jgi:uncharacterized membrane protein YoaK (UPF0700 family)
MPLSDPQSPQNQSNPLIAAMLLAATGGMLDAVVYLNHGHVFANAMTGNVIFLGIAIIGRDWGTIVPHLVPLVGFLAGVTTSKHMRTRLSEGAVLRIGLTSEAIALFLLGWLPLTFPHMAFTLITAFVSAFQVSTYRRVERFTFNSTFVTGNLRDMIEGLYDVLRPATPEIREKGLAQATDLGLICLCFLAGAIIGAWAAPRFGNYALWFTEPLLLAALMHRLRHPS